jgi:hypothetical protein
VKFVDNITPDDRLPSQAKTADRNYIYDLIINNRLTVRSARRLARPFVLCTMLRLFTYMHKRRKHRRVAKVKWAHSLGAETTSGKNKPLLTEQQTCRWFSVSLFIGEVFAYGLNANINLVVERYPTLRSTTLERRLMYYHRSSKTTGAHLYVSVLVRLTSLTVETLFSVDRLQPPCKQVHVIEPAFVRPSVGLRRLNISRKRYRV